MLQASLSQMSFAESSLEAEDGTSLSHPKVQEMGMGFSKAKLYPVNIQSNH